MITIFFGLFKVLRKRLLKIKHSKKDSLGFLTKTGHKSFYLKLSLFQNLLCATYMPLMRVIISTFSYLVTSKTVAWDCLIIPGAKKTAGAEIVNQNFCGGRLVTANASGTNKTICSKLICIHKFFIGWGITKMFGLTSAGGRGRQI
jgi:hypothetical protein